MTSPARLRAGFASRSGDFSEFVERAAVAFDHAVADLFQIDILQNNGPAVSTFKGQRAAGADRLAPCDL